MYSKFQIIVHIVNLAFMTGIFPDLCKLANYCIYLKRMMLCFLLIIIPDYLPRLYLARYLKSLSTKECKCCLDFTANTSYVLINKYY